MSLNTRLTLSSLALLAIGMCQGANAAIALDRTRVIFDGGKDATSVNITNNNTQLPYLAQGWIEDEQGQKITAPLIVLPPVQRVEPGKQSQVKVQALPAAKSLPQDRETVYYFNLREIPPRSDKANTLQIALQTRIKLFYRPQAITPSQQDLSNPWQEKLTLSRQGEHYQVNKPDAVLRDPGGCAQHQGWQDRARFRAADGAPQRLAGPGPDGQGTRHRPLPGLRE